MSNYLVTGGHGFIGSHLVEALLRENEDNVVWVVDNGERAAWNPRKGRVDADEQMRDLLVQIMGGYEIDNDPRAPRLVNISGDCAHRNVLSRIRAGHFRAVFHLAADTSVAKSIEDPVLTLEQNVAKTLKLAQACADGHTRLIFSSSAAVYGNNDSPYGVAETQETKPTNPYGLSKLTCENWFHAYKDLYGLDYVNLRYFNVYGERQQGGSPYAGVIGNWIHALHFKKPLTVYGDGEQTRDFVHVEDIARANIKAVDAITTEFHTYNVCSGTNTSLNDVLSILGDEVVESFRINNEDGRQGEVKDSIGNNTRALVGLEWAPAINLREGIRRTLKWRGVR